MTALRPAPDPTLTPAGEIAAALGVDPARGLSAEEAARRLAEHGPNEIDPEEPVPTWLKILEQFRDPLIYLLLAAIVISLVAWALEGAEGLPTDAVVIALIVVANAVLGYIQEARAANAVAALARMSETTVAVVREGRQQRIPSRELVVGDVLVLAEGDAVGADGRLLEANALEVTEASLTGESEPVLKDPRPLLAAAVLGDRFNMVYNGTAVTQGVGRAVVTATGMATEMGTIAALLHETHDDETPLQLEIARIGRMLGIAVVVIAAVVMATIFLTSEVDTPDEVVSALLLGVSLAVAAVPEGLPTIVTLVLAVGVQRLAQHRAIVKKLSSVETLGSASVICSDKTGTLTKGEMTIGRILTASGAADVTGVGYRPEGRIERDGRPIADHEPAWAEIAAVLAGGSLANDAELREVDGQWVVLGDPTEGAFLVAEQKLGLAEQRVRRFRRFGEIPFTSERKLMTALAHDAAEGAVAVVTKGAPDILVERCTHARVGTENVPLTADQRERLLADVDELSSQAFRTLGVAYRHVRGERPERDEDLEAELVYLGTVGILDPARAEAAEAVTEARRAGIRIIMITGDHPGTAARIAADLGIVEGDAPAATGAMLDAMDDTAFRDTVRRTSVYARVTPTHKLRIVDALRDEGRVVAMTGDGVNDAPALKAADIGVAMGIAGTEVTKEAANMILADDNFATIVRAVREGRGIFANIRKAMRYLLSSNMGEVLTVFLGVVLGGLIGLEDSAASGAVVLPLLATQILWINLLTDSAPALALGVDPQSDDVMARRPRALTDRVIDARMWTSVLVVGVVMALVTLVTLDRYLPGGLVEGDRDLTNARTAAFTVLVLAQLFNAFVSRSATGTTFRGLFANRWLWLAVGLSLLLQVAVVHLPFLNEAFGTSALDLGQWLFAVAMASAVLWVAELHKLVTRAVAAWGRQ
jgi:magnesium-transporting ATPase (P-type)